MRKIISHSANMHGITVCGNFWSVEIFKSLFESFLARNSGKIGVFWMTQIQTHCANGLKLKSISMVYM